MLRVEETTATAFLEKRAKKKGERCENDKMVASPVLKSRNLREKSKKEKENERGERAGRESEESEERE